MFSLTLGNSNQAPAYLYQALTDTMPAGMTIPSGATVSSTCTNGTPTVTTTSLTLPSGLSIPAGGCTVTVSSVSVSSAGTFTNTIAGGSLVASTGTVSGTATATFTVATPTPPSFTITKSDGGATFYTGTTATYTVTVTNNVANSYSSGAINIRDALPAGLTLASVAVASGSAVTGTISNVSAAGSSGTVGWDFTPSASMAQNQTATFVLTVNVGAGTPVGTNSITNYISVGGGGGAAVPMPGSTCSTSQCGQDLTTVATPTSADLSVTKTDGTSSLTAGGSTVYTVRVTNKSTVNVPGAVLTDAAPSGLSFTSVTCSTASGNTCSTAPTASQLASGFTLPTLAPGAFYELSVAASTSLSSGSVTNTASVRLPSGYADPNTGDNTASDTDNIVAAPTSQPSANNTSYPATCDLVDWSKSGITGTAVGQTGTRNFNSFDGVPLSVNLVPATSAGNGIVGLNTGFSNYGSWYTVRAVSTSMSPSNTAPSYGGAFVTRAGGDGQTNTITITFPHPVINVRFGVTDLDAAGGASVADQGDWLRATAAYNGTTFNPDTLIAGGHALAVKGYTTTGAAAPGTAASGASMTIPVPGRGNSSMGAGSNPNTLNTLMGVDTTYGTQVTDPQNGGSPVNRQGQGVVYFKGPLTSLTIVTGSKKTSGNNAIGFGNVDFCSPSMSVSKSAGTPVMQPDGTSNIPYSLTFSNTSYNTGLYPDTTVRDNPFLPSFATPAGLDPWADLKPQLSDNVVTQLKAVSNVGSATVIGAPKVSFGSTPTNTYNLDATDANPAFDGETNPLLMTGNTDARVKPGGSFTANFTVNLGLKSTAGTTQNVTNTATSSSTFNSGSFSATSNTVTSVVSKPLPTPLSCTTMYGLTSSYSTVATGGTSPILTPTDQIQEITNGGLGGNIITQLPSIVSRNADGSLRVDAYALAISPDRRYLFIATNSTNSTDKNAFYYYDMQTGTWSTPFPLAAANSGAYQGPQRMVVTQSGRDRAKSRLT